MSQVDQKQHAMHVTLGRLTKVTAAMTLYSTHAHYTAVAELTRTTLDVAISPTLRCTPLSLHVSRSSFYASIALPKHVTNWLRRQSSTLTLHSRLNYKAQASSFRPIAVPRQFSRRHYSVTAVH